MTKRALIIGISDYAGIAPCLRSSATESQRWRDLLVEQYGFGTENVRFLAEYHATKTATLDRLTWLLAHSTTGDQLVFVFCGHGLRGRRQRLNGDPSDVCEEALLLHPGGSSNANEASLFAHEVAALYYSMAVAPGALATFIFDCCFSAGVDLSPSDAMGGFLAASAGLSEWDRRTAAIARFGLRLAHASNSAQPVVIGASSESAFATEIEVDGVTRSRFSRSAISALRSNPALTYEKLVEDVSLQLKTANQEPSLRGTPERLRRPFLG